MHKQLTFFALLFEYPIGLMLMCNAHAWAR